MDETTDALIVIDDPETERIVREPARELHVSEEEAVLQAVTNKLRRINATASDGVSK